LVTAAVPEFDQVFFVHAQILPRLTAHNP
jgi:hypothetical protein